MRISLIKEFTYSWRIIKNEKIWRQEWKNAYNSIRDNGEFKLHRIAAVGLLLVVMASAVIGVETEMYVTCNSISFLALLISLYCANRISKMIDDHVLLNFKPDLTNQFTEVGHG